MVHMVEELMSIVDNQSGAVSTLEAYVIVCAGDLLMARKPNPPRYMPGCDAGLRLTFLICPAAPNRVAHCDVLILFGSWSSSTFRRSRKVD
jgi:hypothetical protein